MATSLESIELYCRAAQEYKASDLILQSGEPPIVRVSGSITPMEAPVLSPNDFKAFREQCGVPESAMDHDASFVSQQGVRFRVNFHRQLGSDGAVLRRINANPPEIDQLGVPSDLLKSVAGRRSGIVIVSGPTGSGKSTTLAAMLEWINRNMERHIVTIEDPVELYSSGTGRFSPSGLWDSIRQVLQRGCAVLCVRHPTSSWWVKSGIPRLRRLPYRQPRRAILS